MHPKKHAKHFIDGITPKNAKDFDGEIHHYGSVGRPTYVKYDKPLRYVALYEVAAPPGSPTGLPPLRIGFQVKDLSSAADAYDWGVPSMLFPHYHQVWASKTDSIPYHVVTGV